MTVRRCLVDAWIAIAIGLIPATLLFWIFDKEVPRSISYDISERIYPEAVAWSWLLLALLQAIVSFVSKDKEVIHLNASQAKFQLLLLSVVFAGFFILLYIGYIVGAMFYIIAMSWMLRERGWPARVLAIAVPLVVYVVMELAFDVRLPSIINT